MKRLLIALIATSALASPAFAAHKARINCGWPHPDAACHATPPVAPASVTPASTPPAKDIFSGLLQFQGDVVAGLQQADTTEAAPINPATGAA